MSARVVFEVKGRTHADITHAVNAEILTYFGTLSPPGIRLSAYIKASAVDTSSHADPCENRIAHYVADVTVDLVDVPPPPPPNNARTMRGSR